MISKKLVLNFPKEITDKPIVYKLIKDYNLRFNLLKASVSPDKEGLLVMEIKGEKEDFDKGIKYLEENKVKIEPLSEEVTRDENLCTHCTACISHCPTGALSVKDRDSMEVIFDKEKCIACGACVNVCSYKAMRIDV